MFYIFFDSEIKWNIYSIIVSTADAVKLRDWNTCGIIVSTADVVKLRDLLGSLTSLAFCIRVFKVNMKI